MHGACELVSRTLPRPQAMADEKAIKSKKMIKQLKLEVVRLREAEDRFAKMAVIKTRIAETAQRQAEV